MHGIPLPYNKIRYNVSIQEAIERTGISESEACMSLKVTYCILHTPGQVILVSENEDGYVLGKVQFCIVEE